MVFRYKTSLLIMPTDSDKDKKRFPKFTGKQKAELIKRYIDASNKFLLKNKKNLFTVITAKESPAAFKKLSNNFEKNQLLLRYCLKDLFNYMVV